MSDVARTEQVPVRLIFADQGSFHETTIRLPADVLARHERLVDALREGPIAAGIYVDRRRLVAAFVEKD